MERWYSGEDYIDAAEHIDECMDSVPKDEHGFATGSFKVVVYHDKEG